MPGGVIEITSEEQYAREVSREGALIIVDFYATWCGPCRAVAPQIEALAREFPQCIFLKVDVDKMSSLSQENEISAMPTFLLIRGGDATRIETIVGGNVPRLRELIVEHGASSSPSVAAVRAASPGTSAAGGSSSSTLPPHQMVIYQALQEASTNPASATQQYEKIAVALKDSPAAEQPVGLALLPHLVKANIQALDGFLKYAAQQSVTGTASGGHRNLAETVVRSILYFCCDALSWETWDGTQWEGIFSMLEVLFRVPTAAEYVVSSKRFLPSENVCSGGRELQLNSVFGSIVGVGPFNARSTMQDEAMSLVRLFPPAAGARGMQQHQEDGFDSSRGKDAVHRGLARTTPWAKALIHLFLGSKGKPRESMLNWMAQMLKVNAGYTKVMPNPAVLSTRSAMTTLCRAYVLLALPVVERPSFEQDIPVQYLIDPKAVISWGTDVERIVHESEKNVTLLPKEYPPKVHLFFLAIRALSLAQSTLLVRLTNLKRQLQHPEIPAHARPVLTAEINFAEALLGDVEPACEAARFLNAVAQWLLHVAKITETGVSPQSFPVETWGILPREIVDDVVRSTQLFTVLKIQVPMHDLQSIISLMMVIMGNTNAYPHPHTHAVFPELLISLLNDPGYQRALFEHPFFAPNVVLALFRCYIVMEKCEMERAQSRLYISLVLKELMKNEDLCSYAAPTLNEATESLLERYTHMLTAEANAALESSIATLEEIRGMEAANNGNPPMHLSQYKEKGDQLRSGLTIFNVAMDVFLAVTEKFPGGCEKKLVAQQICSMLTRSLVKLAGPANRDLKVIKPEQYNFDPRKLLASIVECFVRFQDSDFFVNHVSVSGPQKEEIHSTIMNIMSRELVPEDLLYALEKMYKKITSAEEDLELESELLDGAPDFAKCQLLDELLTDPVELPMEGGDDDDRVVMNRDSVHHMLLEKEQHPFTRNPLNMEQVNEFNRRPEVKKRIAELKKKIRDWKETRLTELKREKSS